MKCKGHFCSNLTTLSFCSLRGTAPLFNYSVCFYIAVTALLSLISDTSPLCKPPGGWAMRPAGSHRGPRMLLAGVGTGLREEEEAEYGEGELILGFQS